METLITPSLDGLQSPSCNRVLMTLASPVITRVIDRTIVTFFGHFKVLHKCSLCVCQTPWVAGMSSARLMPVPVQSTELAGEVVLCCHWWQLFPPLKCYPFYQPCLICDVIVSVCPERTFIFPTTQGCQIFIWQYWILHLSIGFNCTNMPFNNAVTFQRIAHDDSSTKKSMLALLEMNVLHPAEYWCPCEEFDYSLNLLLSVIIFMKPVLDRLYNAEYFTFKLGSKDLFQAVGHLWQWCSKH